MYNIKWFDMNNGKLIVRSYKGNIVSEDAESVTFTYRKKATTLAKSDCTVWKWDGAFGDWKLAN